MAVAEIMPTANQLTKLGKMQSAWCWLCRRSREAQSESAYNLAVETYGHINRSGCKGMALTVTATHHCIWRLLYDRPTKCMLHISQKASSSLSRLTKESTIGTLWQRK